MAMRKELLLLEEIYTDRVEVVSVGGEMYYRVGNERGREEKKEKKPKVVKTTK